MEGRVPPGWLFKEGQDFPGREYVLPLHPSLGRRQQPVPKGTVQTRALGLRVSPFILASALTLIKQR